MERDIWPPELRRRVDVAGEEGDGALKVGRLVVGEGILLLLDGEALLACRSFFGCPGAAVGVGDGGLVFMAFQANGGHARYVCRCCCFLLWGGKSRYDTDEMSI
jgi:hypothetical protein